MPRVAPLGDSAMVVELGTTIDTETNARVHALDAAVRGARLPGVTETVPAYASLLVHVDPRTADPRELAAELRRLAEAALAGRGGDSEITPVAARRVIEIPVRYGGDDGPDLTELARRVGLSEDEVVRRHAGRDYVVAMLGFAPGFPYLMGLDPSIACPRLDTARVRVPAGSVAIAELQTGIYPFAMPGGWRLIGRTAMTLFDPLREAPATVAPGDRVRFVATEEGPDATAGAPATVGERAASSARRASADAPKSGRTPTLRIVDPGLQATVQDAGRFGYQRFGVPPSGAADPVALAAANAAVGNRAGAAAVEMTAGGVEIEFLEPVLFALAGAPLDARLDGREVPFAAAITANVRDRLRLGRPTHGFRTYLAVAGGIDVPPLLGSRATYLPAGFGGFEGRALRAGDALSIGGEPDPPPQPTGRPAEPSSRAIPTAGKVELAYVASGQWDRLSEATRSGFVARRWVVSHRSDRMGLRLEGEALEGAGGGHGFVSDGTVTGAIQLSGDGMPIVLLVDRQTTGGYPKLGAVASSQLHLLGQLQPGDEVTFSPISLAEARARLRAERPSNAGI